MIPEILLLVKQICPATSQVDDLRTTIPILLQSGTLEAVERVTDPLSTAHDAFVLVVAEAALVADAHQRGRAHVGIAYGAFAVAFVAKTSQRDAWCFATHYEIGVVAGHGEKSWRESAGVGQRRGAVLGLLMGFSCFRKPTVDIQEDHKLFGRRYLIVEGVCRSALFVLPAEDARNVCPPISQPYKLILVRALQFFTVVRVRASSCFGRSYATELLCLRNAVLKFEKSISKVHETAVFVISTIS